MASVMVMVSRALRFLAASLLLLLAPYSSLHVQAAETPTFESAILPILQARCIVCHSGQTPQANLNLQSKSAILTGGKSGRAIVVGSSEKSLLVERIVSGTMPPAGE